MFLIAVLPRVREAEPQSGAFPVGDWERGNEVIPHSHFPLYDQT